MDFDSGFSEMLSRNFFFALLNIFAGYFDSMFYFVNAIDF